MKKTYFRRKHYHATSPWTGWLFLLPQLMFFSIFTIYPVFEGLRISLYDTTYVTETFVGLQNYIDLFRDKIFRMAVRNTLFLTVVVVPVTLLLGLFISIAIFDKRTKYISAVRSLYYLPVIVSNTVMAMVWNFLLNPASGLVNYLVGRAGGEKVNLLGSRSHVLWVIAFVTIVASVGQTVIMYVAAMIGIPGDLFDAAKVDGASKTKWSFRIVIPLVKPTTLYLTVINTISIMKLFVIIQLLTDGGPNNASMTMMYYLYRNAFVYDKTNLAAAIGVFMLLLSILLVIPQFKALSNPE